MKNKVFISYRRQDSAWSTRVLHNALGKCFGTDNVFIDIDDIDYGDDFIEKVEREIGCCDAMIAVIGRNWWSATDDHGDRRLDNPNDYVRLEIGMGLKRRIPVIPVLVDGAKMPRENELPEDLKALSRRNAIELRHSHCTTDTDLLIESISTNLSPEQKKLVNIKNSTPGSRNEISISWIGLAVAVGGVIIVGLTALYIHWTSHKKENISGVPLLPTGGNVVAGHDINVGGNIITQAQDPATQQLIETIVNTLTKQLEAKDLQLQERDDQIKQLTKAVSALAAQRGKPDAPPGIDAALDKLEQGDTENAEAIFQIILETTVVKREASAAARHLGALASLNDPQKALVAYRRATELNPGNVDGWIQLDHLLRRVGDVAPAESAYLDHLPRRVGDVAPAESAYCEVLESAYREMLERGEARDGNQVPAVAYDNLGSSDQIGGASYHNVKGRIEVVSKQAATIQIDVKGKHVVVRTDANTQFDGAAGLKDLDPPDLIEVKREPGKAATRIKKLIFGLPPGVEISVEELLKIMTGGPKYCLFDARPVKHFGAAHIPSAAPAFPKDENFLSLLPADKDALLVFYCGGPTCPYTGVAVGMAQEAGHTNLKGFQAGLPGWTKSKLPVHSEASWLAKNLNTQHVILDVRDRAASKQSHIQGAVALPVSELQAMTQRFIAEQKEPELPDVTDLRAPVVVYADSHTSKEALLAYKELRNWGYKGTTVLNGGLTKWVAAGLPTAQGAAATTIVFEKKLAPGAIAPKEFVALAQSRDAVLFVDVRTDQEAATGVIKDARHIPLEQLEDRLAELPKDKEIVLYCANGIRAEMAYQTLDKQGFRTRFLNETIVIDKNGQYRM